MGLDLGEKRAGVARSDETATIAEAFSTLFFTGKKDLLGQLKNLFEEMKPEKIVVGMPTTLRGEKGPAAEKIEKLVVWLKDHLKGEWVFWDERFSTVEAERVLLEADLSRAKRKNLRDQIAAQRILQNYLDAHQKE